MRKKTLNLLLVLCLVFGVLSLPIDSQAATFELSLPPGFVAEKVIQGPGAFGGGEVPTSMAWLPDGRLFIGLKSGRIRVWQNGAFLANDFINLSDGVADNVDRGLEGLAVHPNFPAQPYVYVYYVHDPVGLPINQRDSDGARVSRMVRITADVAKGYNEAVAGSEVILLGKNSLLSAIGDTTSFTDGETCFNKTVNGTFYPGYVPDCLPQDSSTHAGGALTFGTDGSLFVSVGDGAGYGAVDPRGLRAIRLESVSGKVLRIDPITGNGVPGNPNYNAGSPGSDLSKIYSRGMRNPFRIAVNPINNQPYVGDIGDGSWEEINSGAGNYGWPCYEGGNGVSLEQPGYTNDGRTAATCSTFNTASVQPSVYAYAHYQANFGNDYNEGSIIAGAFYSGTNFPAEYQNALFFTDYVHDWIRYLKFDNNWNVTGVYTFANEVQPQANLGPVQLNVGPDNNLYVLVFDWTGNSSLTRIRYTGSLNHQPTAIATATPLSGQVPLKVTFDGSQSHDQDADPLTYEWNFGDGTYTNTINPVYTYTVSGNYTVTLTVTDTGGLSANTQLYLTAGNNAPVVTITAPSILTTWKVGDNIAYSGVASDPEDGPLSGNHLNWEVGIVHGSHNHPAIHTSTGNSGSFDTPDHGNNLYFEICLTATDSGGLKTRKCVDVQPQLSTFQFSSVPSGQQIAFAGLYHTTPFTVSGIVGSLQAIAAPIQQNGLIFQSWSNSAPNSFTITVPANPQALTATYLSTAPIAHITATTTSNVAPSLVALDGRGSSAGGTNAGIQSYAWDFGDGYTSTLPAPTHVFANGGAYTVTLTVRNFANQAITATKIVRVNNAEPTGSNLPLSLQVIDLGAVALRAQRAKANAPEATEALGSGSNYQNGQLVTCSRNGSDIYNDTDGAMFTYRRVSGDSEIIGRLLDVSRKFGPYDNKAGVMLRESLDANAKSVWIGTSSIFTSDDPLSPLARFSLRYHWRAQTGGPTDGMVVDTGGAVLPQWFKLSRTGNTFVGSLSSDGVSWTAVATQTIAMATNVFAGYATTSIDATRFSCAQFDNLIINNNPQPGTPPTAVITVTPTTGTAPLIVSLDGSASASAGTTPGIRFYQWTFGDGYSETTTAPTITHVYRDAGAYVAQLRVTNFDDLTATANAPINVAATTPLTNDWSNLDVNVLGLDGRSGFAADGSLAVCGSGNDIQGSSDSFQFAYRTMLGDGNLVARMRDMELTGPFGGKAGLMIRASTQANASYVSLLQKRDPNPLDQSLQSQIRPQTGADTTYNDLGPYAQPQWLRLNRSGNVFSAYTSVDGVAWTMVQSNTIAMTETVLAGFAVSSVDVSLLNCAQFDRIAFVDSMPVPPPPKRIFYLPLVNK